MSLSQYFKLIDIQARMDLRADASKYFLGYIWWLLEPLLYVLVFYVVFNIVLDTGRSDFLVFLMCGKLAFIWFSKSVSIASNSIIDSKGLIGSTNIPKTLFPMTIVQKGLYKQATVFLLLFAVLLANGYSVSMVWLWVIPVILVNYLMIVACSFIGAYLVCLVRDFSLFITMAMIFLMFTSGLFWDVRELSDPAMIDMVLTLNPLAFMLDAYRQIFMYQTPPNAFHLSQIGLISCLVIYLMVKVLRLSSQQLALKVLTS